MPYYCYLSLEPRNELAETNETSTAQEKSTN